MNRFIFWQRWLLIAGVALVAFGLALALFGDSALFDLLFNDWIDPVFWGATAPPVQALGFRTWIYGVLGAVIAGWGVTIGFIAHHPFRARERWARDAVGLGIGLWFVVDTAVSLGHGVGFNLVVNLIVLALLLPPLWFTRRAFPRRG